MERVNSLAQMTTQKQIAEAAIEYLTQHKPPYKLDDSSDRPTYVDMCNYVEKKLYPNGGAPKDFVFEFHLAVYRLVKYSKPKNRFYLNKRIKI